MKRVLLGLLALAMTVGGIESARADAIPTLFNTGVDASGVSLPDGTIGDLHYTLTSVPGGTSELRVRTSAGGYPIPPYFGDSPTSAWIGPNNDEMVDGPIGFYTYLTTFSLAGFAAGTASITGGWSTDNDGVAILLNGVDTLTPPTSFVQFALGFAPFSLTSGFLPGVNTLEFVVNNGGGPTALRVDLAGMATPVPEPSTYALLLAGLGMLGFIARRRMRG